MPIEKTEGFVLKAYNWSESSRTIVFFTRKSGKLSLTDRGGRSLKSKRGRAIPFARLELTYYSSERESAGHLSEVNIEEAWTFEDESALGRLAFGSAVCEMLRLTLPDHEPHEDLYIYSLKFFRCLSKSPREALLPLFVCYYLRAISFLGYRPVLSACVACGRKKEDFSVSARFYKLSPDRGGVICNSCQSEGERYIQLSAEDMNWAAALQTSSLEEAESETISYQRAFRVLDALLWFLKTQTGIGKINSLDFLNKLKQAQGSLGINQPGSQPV
ncbi:MAG: DNA repair protein RecO [candidate division Zixibacteria bacterium]|nr:DNA repair protein RecO [candidate division Zixibacteria bacterium]